jgi:hypothetical protein
MTKLRLALVSALGILLLMPQAAAAGGWWSYIDVSRSTVVPGQRVVVDEDVAFSSTAAAEDAQRTDPFYVYLLRDFDYTVVERAMREASPGDWWSLGDAKTVRVAQVDVSVSDANLGRARAEFTVPELPPATYHLMLCDAGCAEPLGDVIPTKDFAVVGDPVTAQLVERLDRLELRSRDRARHLGAARREAHGARAAALDARSEVGQLEATVSSLAGEGRGSARVTPWTYAGWFVAGALAGALAVLFLRRRRSRPARTAGCHPSDEELRELLSSEPAHSGKPDTDPSA